MSLRVGARKNRKLEQAAARAETTGRGCVTKSALDAAGQTEEVLEKIALREDDWNAFYDALVDPPEPNEALKRAARRYRKRTNP